MSGSFAKTIQQIVLTEAMSSAQRSKGVVHYGIVVMHLVWHSLAAEEFRRPLMVCDGATHPTRIPFRRTHRSTIPLLNRHRGVATRTPIARVEFVQEGREQVHVETCVFTC